MIQHLSQILNWKSLPRYVLMSLVGLFLIIQVWTFGATPASATGVYEIPTIAAGDATWVVDHAGILSRITRSEISNKLENLSKATGNEVRLVTIHRLDYGETIETFVDKLFDTWFSTSDAQTNQVILALDNVNNIWKEMAKIRNEIAHCGMSRPMNHQINHQGKQSKNNSAIALCDRVNRLYPKLKEQIATLLH